MRDAPLRPTARLAVSRGHADRRLVLVASIVLAAGIWVLSIQPPRAQHVVGDPDAFGLAKPQARGGWHVHTRRSDGSGSMDDVARAAAEAGLDFVVFADHGDGTRAPEPPSYRWGVLCIDGVEISSAGGHVIALGLSAPTPFPLGGQSRDVVEDIHRFGGMAIVAHPDSPKPALRWKDWSVPVDGFEYLNADSEWRNETAWEVVRALTTYWWRGPETIAALFERPVDTLSRWDDLSRQQRRLVAISGTDAHARLGTDDENSGTSNYSLPFPGYAQVLRVVSTHVILDAPLRGEPDGDARRVLRALRAGSVYSTVDAYARGGMLELSGETETTTVTMGQPVEPGQLVRVRAKVMAPAGTTLRLLEGGAVIAESSGTTIEVGRDVLGDIRAPTALRLEAALPGAASDAAPWLVSNPIWITGDDRAPDTALAGGADASAQQEAGEFMPLPLAASLADGRWRIEKDPATTATLRAMVGQVPGLRLDFTLGETRSSWVAAALTLSDPIRRNLTPSSSWLVRFRSTSPMRVAVQMRAGAPDVDQRWTHSLFLDASSRSWWLPLTAFQPINAESRRAQAWSSTALLVVVDRTNTAALANGTVWIDEIALRTAAPASGPSRANRQ